MTELESPVSRRTRRPHARWNKRIVATLVPGDVLSLRLERSRGPAFMLDLHQLYDQAEARHARAVAGLALATG